MNTYNAEQTAALQALTDRYNESAGTTLTPDEYLDVDPNVNELVV